MDEWIEELTQRMLRAPGGRIFWTLASFTSVGMIVWFFWSLLTT